MYRSVWKQGWTNISSRQIFKPWAFEKFKLYVSMKGLDFRNQFRNIRFGP